jgi:hypothetical protein
VIFRRDHDVTDPTTDRALLGMAKIVVSVESADRVQARRERLTLRLSAFTDDVWARTPRRSRRLRIAMSAVAAVILTASLCMLAWRALRTDTMAARDAEGGAVVRASEGAVRIRHAGAPTDAVVAEQAPFPLNLGAQDRIETTDGHADVNLASGAVVALDAATELELGAVQRSPGTISERIELVAGKISVKVPKLSAGSRLVVGTPHSTITVHGTAFVVEVQRTSDGNESFTTVSVTEGRVSVEREGREVFLGPGTQWSSRGRPASAVGSGELPSVPSGEGGGETASGSEARSPRADLTAAPPKVGSLAVRNSTLPQENLLLRSAMRARRDGDPKRALELIARLLRTYPASPLGPEARVERTRALSDLDAKPAP